MKTNLLDYYLPNVLIAQEPVEPRDSSRLLVLDRQSGLIDHRKFRDLGSFLRPGDLLVVNDTKVLPARLVGKKQGTGAKIEVLLLAKEEPEIARHSLDNALGKAKDVPFVSEVPNCRPVWEVLAKPAKRLRKGDRIDFSSGLKAEITEELEQGQRLLEFESEKPLLNVLQNLGEVPLPPYIITPLLHPERYQTVYAKKPESAAAPTAGLHFTPGLIEQLQDQGINFANLTLRIGLDTFQPIRSSSIEEHVIHSEYYEVSAQTAELLNKTVKDKHRIIAVGTTSARVLETLETIRLAQNNAGFRETSGYTDLFIVPGYRFKTVDAMITNFHLPRTTLLAMASTFAGLEKIKTAYIEAVNKKYRFFSFGDAMLII